ISPPKSHPAEERQPRLTARRRPGFAWPALRTRSAVGQRRKGGRNPARHAAARLPRISAAAASDSLAGRCLFPRGKLRPGPAPAAARQPRAKSAAPPQPLLCQRLTKAHPPPAGSPDATAAPPLAARPLAIVSAARLVPAPESAW